MSNSIAGEDRNKKRIEQLGFKIGFQEMSPDGGWIKISVVIGWLNEMERRIKLPIPVNQDETELWENIIVKIENAEFLKHKYVDTINELKSKYTVQLKSSPSPYPSTGGVKGR